MKTIEFFEWEKLPGGYVRKDVGRTFKLVLKDIRTAIDKEKMPYEYITTNGWDEEEAIPLGRCQTVNATLATGANEGFSIQIYTTYQIGPRYHEQWVNMDLFRIKLLCDQDDALKVYAFVLKLLGHFR